MEKRAINSVTVAILKMLKSINDFLYTIHRLVESSEINQSDEMIRLDKFKSQ